MSVSEWLNWVLSVIVTAVNWLSTITILGAPVLYVLVAIVLLGIIMSAILFRAR